MDPFDLQKHYLQLLETVSGKPVLVQADPQFQGHATLRLARGDQPGHVLLYKPQNESVLPYLAVFQCVFGLRRLEASPEARFELHSRPEMEGQVFALVRAHIRPGGEVPQEAIPKLAHQFGHGLGFQLRSMPIAMRVDAILHRDHPELRPMQRKNLEQQLQENVFCLDPRVKKMAPSRIVTLNASMNSAFALGASYLWNEPTIALPYRAAGYGERGESLYRIVAESPQDPNHDIQVVRGWLEVLELQNWFEVVER